jgi:hypothetical protein
MLTLHARYSDRFEGRYLQSLNLCSWQSNCESHASVTRDSSQVLKPGYYRRGFTDWIGRVETDLG